MKSTEPKQSYPCPTTRRTLGKQHTEARARQRPSAVFSSEDAVMENVSDERSIVRDGRTRPSSYPSARPRPRPLSLPLPLPNVVAHSSSGGGLSPFYNKNVNVRPFQDAAARKITSTQFVDSSDTGIGTGIGIGIGNGTAGMRNKQHFHYNPSQFATIQQVLHSIHYRSSDSNKNTTNNNNDGPLSPDFNPTPIKPEGVEVVSRVDVQDNSWHNDSSAFNNSVAGIIRATLDTNINTSTTSANSTAAAAAAIPNNKSIKGAAMDDTYIDELLEPTMPLQPTPSTTTSNSFFEQACQRLAEGAGLSSFGSSSDLSQWSETNNKEEEEDNKNTIVHDEDNDVIFTDANLVSCDDGYYNYNNTIHASPRTDEVDTGQQQDSHSTTNTNTAATTDSSTTTGTARNKTTTKATNGNTTNDEDDTEHMETSLSSLTSSACQSQLSCQWYQRYNELVEFKKVHGHCVVPHNWPKNRPLGQWVKRQRYQRKLKVEGQHSTLTQDREDALSKLGFVWDSHVSGWEERFEELRQYRDAHGHCHVPTTYPENPQLAVWVKCQRRQFKLYMTGRKSTMNQDRVSKLVGLGFVWNPRGLKV